MSRRRSSNIHIWPAFSDLLSGLLLTFLVIFLHQTTLLNSLKDEDGNLIKLESLNRSELDAVKYKALYEKLLTDHQKLLIELKEMRRSLGASKDMAETVERALNQQGIKATLDTNKGSIEIDESVLFKASEFTISNSTDKKSLMKVGDALRTLLEDGEKSKLISAIMVIGHADQTGDWLYNQSISTRRANALVQMWNRSILNTQDNVTGCVVPKLIAAGVGESRPIVDISTLRSDLERHDACGHYKVDASGDPILNSEGSKIYLPEKGCKKNRRIEIMIVPKPPNSKVLDHCP